MPDGSAPQLAQILIWTLGPISGAHFNPVVTGVAVVRREIRPVESVAYVVPSAP